MNRSAKTDRPSGTAPELSLTDHHTGPKHQDPDYRNFRRNGHEPVPRFSTVDDSIPLN